MDKTYNVLPDKKVEQEHYDVFISYRRKTGLDLARSIAYWFRLKGFKCFIDQTELKSGEFNNQIYSAIAHTQYFLLLLTENALDFRSCEDDWVRREIEHAIDKNITIVPVKVSENYLIPDNLPLKLQRLKDIQASTLDRSDVFEVCLETLVNNQMPKISYRLVKDKNETSLIAVIRSYKSDDGKIDEDELKGIEKIASEYGISESRVKILIAGVEAEWRETEEQKLLDWGMSNFELDNTGHLDAETINKFKEHAVNVGVSENRQSALCRALEVGLQRESELNEQQGNLHRAKLKLRIVTIVFSVLLLSSFALLLFVWFWTGGREPVEKLLSERARFKAEIAKVKDGAERARQEAKKAIQDMAKANAVAETARLSAEKREAAASTAKEMADKAIKAMKAKLDAAVSTARSADVARQDAEKRMVEANAKVTVNEAAFQRARKAIEAKAAEDQKRLAERVVAAETARRIAEIKLSNQTADINHMNEKIKQMEEEKMRLQSEMEKVHRQKQLDAMRDD